MRLLLLDRYLLRSWIRIFVLTALGFPVISVLIKLTDTIGKLLRQDIPIRDILLSFAYLIPEQVAQVMPAAVFFATVFTVGAMSRHLEIIAAQAGGWSFHRLVRPLFAAAAVAAVLAFGIGELSVGASARSLELQRSRAVRPTVYRYNFVYRADGEWIYTVRTLDVAHQAMRDPVLLRQGNGRDRPDLAVSADSATYDSAAGRWRLWGAASRVVFAGLDQPVFEARELRLRALTQRPAELLAASKPPAEMRYGELAEYIAAIRRTGNDVNKLWVEHALRLAIPATCLVIALFGAPLSLASPRSGPAYGIALSLAATVLFLLIVNLAKAVGAGGAVHPVVAAWFPNLLFLAAALVLLRRVRT